MKGSAGVYARTTARSHNFIEDDLGEELEELELSEGAEGEEGVVEWQDLFDGDLLSGGLAEGSDDGAICTGRGGCGNHHLSNNDSRHVRYVVHWHFKH